MQFALPYTTHTHTTHPSVFPRSLFPTKTEAFIPIASSAESKMRVYEMGERRVL